MPPELVTVPTSCTKCDKPVTLQFEQWDYGAPAIEQFWLCPWCTEDQRGRFPAMLVDVRKLGAKPPH